MKGLDLNAVLHAAILHGIFKSPSDAIGVAQYEHRLCRRTRQIFGSKGKDQRLTRSSDAANNSMPLSQAARNLLLKHVHDCKRPVGWIGHHRFVQRQGNLSYADLGKEQRTQPVELRHRQRLSETRINHAPQSGPEFFRVRALRHFILEHTQMLGEHLLEIGLIELLARDIREYDPEAERKNGSAHEAMTGRKQ